MALKQYKTTLLVLLSLAACAVKEPELQLLQESDTLDYQAGSWVTMVTSGGDWTLSPADTYDWISPSFYN